MSVTILAKDCTTADCLATALCVLGPDRGLALVERHPDVSALLVFVRDGKAETVRSKRFPFQ
jgi:thiamine biosynthesis lipoprotein